MPTNGHSVTLWEMLPELVAWPGEQPTWEHPGWCVACMCGYCRLVPERETAEGLALAHMQVVRHA